MSSLAQIEEQLANPNRTVRYRAVYNLSKIEDPKAVQMLGGVLANDAERDLRALAAKLLAKTNFDVTEYLLHALENDRYAQVRRAAAEALGNSSLYDTKAIHGLARCLYDRSKVVRRAIIQSLRLLEGVEAVPELVGVLLGDSDSYVRWEAAKTLAQLQDHSAVPALIEALIADDNSYVRHAAALALGYLETEDSLSVLMEALLNDENSYVRYAAARSLRHHLLDTMDVNMVYTFLYALDDTNSHVWHLVGETLWMLGEDVMPIVLNALTDPDRRVRRVALKAVLWLSAEFDDENLLDIDPPEYEFDVVWGWWN